MSLLETLKLKPRQSSSSDSQGEDTGPDLAAQGEIGHVAPYSKQGSADWKGGKRVSENEHIIPRGKLKAVTFDPATGTSDYTDSHYRKNTSVRVERDMALDKTHPNRGGENADNAGTARLKAKAKSGDPAQGIDVNQEVLLESVDNANRSAQKTGSATTAGQRQGGAVAQVGELFGIQRAEDTGRRVEIQPGDVDAAIAAVDPDTTLELRRSIDATRRNARQTLKQVNEIAPVLEKNIAAADGPRKQELIAKRDLLAKKQTEAVAAIERADADLEAIANPSTRREDLAAIKARRGSRESMAAEVELDSAGLLKPGKATSSDKTTTTSSLDNGRATVNKVRSTSKLGADGLTSTESDETTVSGKHLTAKSATSKKANVSLTGKASVEEKTSREVELADGRKAGIESTTTKEIGLGGASKTQTVAKKSFDGSATSTTTKKGVERGDGKVTATTGKAVTETNAKGTAVTREGSASGGMVAGKDGLGAHGALEGGKKVASKGGMEAAANAKLHANVVCKVTERKGDPKRYDVSLTVSFGGAISGSGGAGKKEGSKVSADVQVKASAEKSMTVTHVLGEEELGLYVKSLEAASKGDKVAATFNEFAVVTAGVKEGWGAARDLWKGISADTAKSLQHAGDSVEVAEKTSNGVAVAGKVGPVGAGYSVSESDQTSRKVERNDKGTLDVEGKGAHTKQKTASVSMDVGVAGVSVGSTNIHQTRFGFAIEIDPKDDPKGAMVAALASCRKKADYQAFLAKHPKAKMVSQSDGKTDAEQTDVGLSLGGKKVMAFGTGQQIDEDVKTDAQGKVLAKRVAGRATAGGNLGPLADSQQEEAVAEVDEDGEASLTMTRTNKSNYDSRAREKSAKKLQAKLEGKGDGKAKGALATAAGGADEDEDENASHNVEGITLSNKDLRRLGGVAVRSMDAWMGVPTRYQENKDWKAAGVEIARAKAKPSVVAEQLARFVGGDRVRRLETLEQFIRGGYHATTGKRFEFPDSLRDVLADYNQITDDKLADRVNTLANKKGDPAAAEECRRLLAIADRIEPRVQKCNDFKNQATKMEMLKDLMESRNMLARGVKGYGGNLKADSDPKVLAEQGDRLMKQCQAYFQEQTRLVGRMQDQDAYTVSERADGRRLIKQLDDMHHRWTTDYLLLKQNHEQRKVPFADTPFVKPQLEYVATFEKKFGS